MKVDFFFSWRRVRILAGMFLMLLASAISLGMKSGLLADRILANCFILLIFFTFFVYGLEQNRIQAGILDEKSNNFNRIGLFFCIGILLCFVCALLPANLNLILFFAVIFTLVTNSQLGMMGAGIWAVILALSGQAGIMDLCSLLIQIMCGTMIADTFANRKERMHGSLILLGTGVSIPCVFEFLKHYRVVYEVLFEGIISSVLSVFLLMALVPAALKGMGERKVNSSRKIVEETYPLVQDLKAYSRSDYDQARRVSLLSRECGQVAGCKSDICEAAGFYYHIGKLEGEPYVENGVRLAQVNYFPSEVIQILSEYNGEQNTVSTPESAVVYLASLIIERFSKVSREVFENDWEKEMAIYQITNELSQNGTYDQSGLGMNMFIRIREYLMKGDWVNECYGDQRDGDKISV